MIRIDYIREFVKLADTMSFSKASEDLFISQPALSRHISVLEAELGVKLVERNTRNVALTRAGTELYQDFMKLLNADRSIHEHAGALSAGYSSRLRVSSPFYWDAAFIEPMILAFTERYPDVKVELGICDPVEGIELLKRGKTDVCAGFQSQARSSGVAGKKFADERLCVTMSSEHPLAGRASVSLRELKDERFLLLDMDENRDGEKNAIFRLLIRHGIDPAAIEFYRKPSALGLAIRQTGAVCILMNSMGNLRRDYLTSAALADEDCVLPLYLFRRKDDADETVRAFFDMASGPEGTDR